MTDPIFFKFCPLVRRGKEMINFIVISARWWSSAIKRTCKSENDTRNNFQLLQLCTHGMSDMFGNRFRAVFFPRRVQHIVRNSIITMCGSKGLFSSRCEKKKDSLSWHARQNIVMAVLFWKHKKPLRASISQKGVIRRYSFFTFIFTRAALFPPIEIAEISLPRLNISRGSAWTCETDNNNDHRAVDESSHVSLHCAKYRDGIHRATKCRGQSRGARIAKKSVVTFIGKVRGVVLNYATSNLAST